MTFKKLWLLILKANLEMEKLSKTSDVIMCEWGRSTSLPLIKIKHLPWKVKLALSTKNVGVIYYKAYLSVKLAFSLSLTFFSPSPSFRNSEHNYGTPFIKAVLH